MLKDVHFVQMMVMSSLGQFSQWVKQNEKLLSAIPLYVNWGKVIVGVSQLYSQVEPSANIW